MECAVGGHRHFIVARIEFVVVEDHVAVNDIGVFEPRVAVRREDCAVGLHLQE